MAYILLVEDHTDTADWVAKQLREAGHVVEIAERQLTARQLAESTPYELAIVDLQLPDGSGVALIQALRRAKRTLPILILSGSGTDEAMVAGLDAGADDYLVKPVPGSVLLARVRAVLRRGGASQMDTLAVGPLTLDHGSRQLRTPEAVVDLSTQEYLLLDFLLAHAGQVVPRSALQERLWGARFETYTNRVDTAVSRVRRHLEGVSGVRLASVRGVGYRLTVAGA